MLAFSRFSFLLSFLAFAMFAMGMPSKRQSTADIESILTNLQSTTDPIVAQLNALSAGGNATDADVDPLITSLTNAFQTSTDQISALPANVGRSIKRQTTNDVANLAAKIIADVSVALNVKIFLDLKIKVLLGDLDIAINKLLIGLGLVLDGVLILVAKLLVDVAVVLDALGFTLILATLGL